MKQRFFAIQQLAFEEQLKAKLRNEYLDFFSEKFLEFEEANEIFQANNWIKIWPSQPNHFNIAYIDEHTLHRLDFFIDKNGVFVFREQEPNQFAKVWDKYNSFINKLISICVDNVFFSSAAKEAKKTIMKKMAQFRIECREGSKLQPFEFSLRYDGSIVVLPREKTQDSTLKFWGDQPGLIRQLFLELSSAAADIPEKIIFEYRDKNNELKQFDATIYANGKVQIEYAPNQEKDYQSFVNNHYASNPKTPPRKR